MKAVFLGNEDISQIDDDAIEQLKALANQSPNGVARYCLHASPTDPVQEMVIYMQTRACTLPHRQVGKRKSYSVLAGSLCVLFFDENKAIDRQIILTPAGEPGPTVLSFKSDTFHTTTCLGHDVAYVETIPGPFRPEETEWVSWISSKKNQKEVQEYLQMLIDQDSRIGENWRNQPPAL